MQQQFSSEMTEGGVYLAGQCVPSGIYREIESRREVYVDENGILPASLDGRVACYTRIDHTWKQMQPLVREHIASPYSATFHGKGSRGA